MRLSTTTTSSNPDTFKLKSALTDSISSLVNCPSVFLSNHRNGDLDKPASISEVVSKPSPSPWVPSNEIKSSAAFVVAGATKCSVNKKDPSSDGGNWGLPCPSFSSAIKNASSPDGLSQPVSRSTVPFPSMSKNSTGRPLPSVADRATNSTPSPSTSITIGSATALPVV